VTIDGVQFAVFINDEVSANKMKFLSYVNDEETENIVGNL